MKEEMAAAVHEFYRELCKKEGWTVRYDMDYSDLPDEIKADNLAAAERIPEVLALARAGLKVVPEDDPRVAVKADVLEADIEALAEAEHEGWMAQKLKSGWVHGVPRDDGNKVHDLLIFYKDLSEDDKEKDRNAVRHYPDILRIAGYKIVKGG